MQELLASRNQKVETMIRNDDNDSVCVSAYPLGARKHCML
jgi:hypothetical protein